MLNDDQYNKISSFIFIFLYLGYQIDLRNISILQHYLKLSNLLDLEACCTKLIVYHLLSLCPIIESFLFVIHYIILAIFYAIN